MSRYHRRHAVACEVLRVRTGSADHPTGLRETVLVRGGRPRARHRNLRDASAHADRHPFVRQRRQDCSAVSDATGSLDDTRRQSATSSPSPSPKEEDVATPWTRGGRKGGADGSGDGYKRQRWFNYAVRIRSMTVHAARHAISRNRERGMGALCLGRDGPGHLSSAAQ